MYNDRRLLSIQIRLILVFRVCRLEDGVAAAWVAQNDRPTSFIVSVVAAVLASIGDDDRDWDLGDMLPGPSSGREQL